MTRLDAAVAELVAALRNELAIPVERPPDRLLSVGQAARALGISRTTAYTEIAAGRLERLKIGSRTLISQSAVAAYIAWVTEVQHSGRGPEDFSLSRGAVGRIESPEVERG